MAALEKDVPVVAPVAGFRFAAVAAGIRKDGRVDVGLVAMDAGGVAAGVFTRNRVRAAPVTVAAERVRSGSARARLVDSGCANACTGAAGHAATLESTRALAQALGVAEAEVLPASTGVIGQLLPAGRISERAAELVARLSPAAGSDFATAILTTDRWAKVAEARLAGPGGAARLVALGKGAGMIHPDVGLLVSKPAAGGARQATMLVFLLTDAQVARDALESALVASTERTFNLASVDGDTSTNDAVFALASGASGVRVSESDLTAAMTDVFAQLARSMLLDGEGAQHCVEIAVRGLRDAAEARLVARTVATSLLVKTALHGRDANWGRLLAAAGRAGVEFDPERAGVAIAGIEIVRAGVALGGDAEQRAERAMADPSYSVELVLGNGPGHASYLTSDLGHGYVDVNASYRS